MKKIKNDKLISIHSHRHGMSKREKNNEHKFYFYRFFTFIPFTDWLPSSFFSLSFRMNYRKGIINFIEKILLHHKLSYGFVVKNTQQLIATICVMKLNKKKFILCMCVEKYNREAPLLCSINTMLCVTFLLYIVWIERTEEKKELRYIFRCKRLND